MQDPGHKAKWCGIYIDQTGLLLVMVTKEKLNVTIAKRVLKKILDVCDIEFPAPYHNEALKTFTQLNTSFVERITEWSSDLPQPHLNLQPLLALTDSDIPPGHYMTEKDFNDNMIVYVPITDPRYEPPRSIEEGEYTGLLYGTRTPDLERYFMSSNDPQMLDKKFHELVQVNKKSRVEQDIHVLELSPINIKTDISTTLAQYRPKKGKTIAMAECKPIDIGTLEWSDSDDEPAHVNTDLFTRDKFIESCEHATIVLACSGPPPKLTYIQCNKEKDRESLLKKHLEGVNSFSEALQVAMKLADKGDIPPVDKYLKSKKADSHGV